MEARSSNRKGCIRLGLSSHVEYGWNNRSQTNRNGRGRSDQCASRLRKRAWRSEYTKGTQTRKYCAVNWTQLKRITNQNTLCEYILLQRFMGTMLERNIVNIFMELIPGGTIETLLKTYGPFEEDLFRTFAAQILMGVNYIHSKNVVHRLVKRLYRPKERLVLFTYYFIQRH